MSASHRGHDVRLLDALDKLKPHAFEGTAWRIIREGRDVFDGSRGSGRWNPSNLSVLYTALEKEGALAEFHFHISRNQSVFPSKIRHELCELDMRAELTLNLANMDDLVSLGVEREKYHQILYSRTQEIAAASAFMGFDGLLVPSARHTCKNLVLFLDHYDIKNIKIVSKAPIDWGAWRRKNVRNT